ncbi:MAG: prephenate dehydrogenase [Planctomycetota bacterium]|nr:prephenate dehydrogenase [Planctomycetota bacterium]
MQLTRISILGVGLLGGSVGLAAKSLLTSCKVSGYSHRPSTLQTALDVGAIDDPHAHPADAVRNVDLVVLCTPVSVFEDMLRQIGPALSPGTIVTDVGSTKRSVVALAETLLPREVHFVGSHPMAGSEKRGVEFARPDLFQNSLCITTPTRRTDKHALAGVETFWQTLGMSLVRLSPGDHDRLLADVSHLPHALAAALITMQADQGLPLAGKGFLDSTRIAGGDGALWRDILLDNRDNIRASLGRLRHHLVILEKLLEDGHEQALAAWLDQAAARRRDLLNQKLREVNPD